MTHDYKAASLELERIDIREEWEVYWFLDEHYKTIRAALELADRMQWQPIDKLPVIQHDEVFHALLWGSKVGVHIGRCGIMFDKPFAYISHLHGNAIGFWGVTHFMPLPQPPKKS